MTGCPFDVPKFASDTRRVYKCTLCVDRVGVGLQPACVKACPTSCLQFGTKDEMLAIANARVEQLQANGFADAAVYDPPGVGGTGVVTVLAFGSQPELYGLPRDPVVPRAVQFWKGAMKSIGNVAIVGGLLAAAVHFVRYGRKTLDAPGGPPRDDRRAGSAHGGPAVSNDGEHRRAGSAHGGPAGPGAAK
jgi:formate dehydrogenase beta subunit